MNWQDAGEAACFRRGHDIVADGAVAGGHPDATATSCSK
jgi:hypothetical protein